MILLVAGGTLFDIMHKRSARYFFNNWQKTKTKGTRQVGSGEMISLAVQTAVVEGLTSGEFCNPRRRIAHILPVLWYIGALMICGGGYWFWFFIRVDVVSEGNSPFRMVRADLFIVSLLASVTLGLIWALTSSNVFLGLYLIATTVLFGSIPWSKFAHMFFKPAAAFQKRVEQANGSRRNLPPPADSPEIYGSARRHPQHY
jgi:hypothetical protein